METNENNLEQENVFDEALSKQDDETAFNTGACDSGEETEFPPDAGRQDDAAQALSAEAYIDRLERKAAELNDLYLRKAADFENYRKRMTREKQDAIDYANTSLLLDLIPVLDDFERAIAAAGVSQKTEADFTNFVDGVGMIEKRLSGILDNKWGLKRFDSSGDAFDPERHEAIMSEKSADVVEPTVADDLLKGYMLKDRVIRCAKVKVLMPDVPAPLEEVSG
jgi:molecular chaperone GrpE